MPVSCEFRRRSRLAVALLAFAVAMPAGAMTCSATSGPRTATVVELYTSEGCDSCPPADRWLSSTFAPGGVATAIPLAFHVDYWDRLGWKDRFASSAWTERQYAAMRAGGGRFVYTPQVLVQGKDFDSWRSASAAALAAASTRPPRAEIALGATTRAGSIAVDVAVRVPAAADRRGATVEVALVDSGLVSEVKAGENAGKRLAHDHVVRMLEAGPPVDGDGMARGQVVLSLPAEPGSRPAVIALVRNVATGDVLQALALPLGADCAPSR
ncbi:MAG: DUF1223 domain-containing protein [Betaproteobacteria bacterium]